MRKILLIPMLVLMLLIVSACTGNQSMYEITVIDGESVSVHYGKSYYFTTKKGRASTVDIYDNGLIYSKSAEGLKVEVKLIEKEDME